jgi:hypothetical protein
MNSSSTEYAPPYATVTSTNRGGALLMVNIVGLIVSLASVGVRIFMSSLQSKKGLAVYKDDLLCFAGLVCMPKQCRMPPANLAFKACCIIQSALIWTGIVRGNGKSIDLISPQDLVYIQQVRNPFVDTSKYDIC